MLQRRYGGYANPLDSHWDWDWDEGSSWPQHSHGWTQHARPKGKGKGKGRSQNRAVMWQDSSWSYPQDADDSWDWSSGQGPRELFGEVEDASTEKSWKVLEKTRWIEEKQRGTGKKKSYYLYWADNLLWVELSSGSTMALPSITGGLRWGGGGPRNVAPKFTLAYEDAEEDRLSWRKADGEVSNVWLLEEVNVGKNSRYSRDSQPTAWPSSSRFAPNADILGEPSFRALPPNAQSKGLGKGFRRGPRRDKDDAGDSVTHENYRHLADSTWVDEKKKKLDGSGEYKTYKLTWVGRALHVNTGPMLFPLPSIDGGLRWGAPGPSNQAPRFTLADEDIEESRLSWRKMDGSISHVWYRKSGDAEEEK